MKLYVMLLVGAIMLICLNMVNSKPAGEESAFAIDGPVNVVSKQGTGAGAGGGAGAAAAGGAGAAKGAEGAAARGISKVQAPKDACKPVNEDCDENKEHGVKCCHEDQKVKCQKVKVGSKYHNKCVAPPGFKHPKV